MIYRNKGFKFQPGVCNECHYVKPKWIIFYPTSKKRFMPSNFPDLFINGITIEKETVTKFLSVNIDEIVSCKNHINKLSNKTGFLKS